ncbi:glycosyltransferase [Candidatus Woesebacteria bacterium]|nr:glycosyltransferase [Candidatus Woesebacteria bacterium]
MKKVSLIITILNEEETIISLLESVVGQTILPNEFIIVDGGSSDKTIKLINKFVKKTQKTIKFPIKILTKKGNRSKGRNFAIENSSFDWIAITDGGCILDKYWLEELTQKQRKIGAQVVAGYYSAKASTSFEKAVVPYVLVMPDKLDENNFLPATRSVLLNKKIWQNAGKFNENLSDNEDYEFSKRLKNTGVEIGFAKTAIVYWLPRKTLKSFINMIFRFARGDIQAGIVRPKVLLIFGRYFVGLLLLIFGIYQYFWQQNVWILFGLLPVLMLLYILWSIVKNYRYSKQSFYWYPVLQISSDLAVMWGSIKGLRW